MTDPAQIAKALTPAQRKALEWSNDEYGLGCEYAKVSAREHGTTLKSLLKKQIITGMWTLDLNNLGRAVAAELEG